MKLIIFAGGAGTRFWPLSRKILPKQFKEMFDGKSTLQLAAERVQDAFGLENLYVSTNEKYAAYVKEQIPDIPLSNIVAEPERRDLAAAVGYTLMHLRKQGYTGPVGILWADHLMRNVKSFIEVLQKGEELVLAEKEKVVFIAEKPRFANNNLGWIHLGKPIAENLYEFLGWKYKPDQENCDKMFSSGEWYWNPGYFIFDLENMLSLYENLQPTLFSQMLEIEKSIGTVKETETIKRIYPQMEKLHFDTAIAEKVPTEHACVITASMGWSDPGTLYAWKEALVEKLDENLVSGFTYLHKSKDTLVYNEDITKLAVGVGLEGMVVINTKDVLIVVPKDKVLEITELVDRLESEKSFSRYL